MIVTIDVFKTLFGWKYQELDASGTIVRTSKSYMNKQNAVLRAGDIADYYGAKLSIAGTEVQAYPNG